MEQKNLSTTPLLILKEEIIVKATLLLVTNVKYFLKTTHVWEEVKKFLKATPKPVKKEKRVLSGKKILEKMANL